MALGSQNAKQPTRKQILERAAEVDARRQEQIQNQVNIINRMRDEIMVYDAYLGRIAAGVSEAKDVAEEALAEVDKVRARHRQQIKENKDG